MMAFDWQIDFPWLFKSNLLQPLDRLTAAMTVVSHWSSSFLKQCS